MEAIIKPFVLKSNGTSTKQDVTDFIKLLNCGKEEILQSKEEDEQFLLPFSILGANLISSELCNGTVTNVNVAVSGAKVLIEYLYSKLNKPRKVVASKPGCSEESSDQVLSDAKEESEKESPIVINDKYILKSLHFFCQKGEVELSLSKIEQPQLLQLVKNATLPEFFKAVLSERESSRESKRNRNGQSATILEQLTSPLQEQNQRQESPTNYERDTNVDKADKNLDENILLFSSRCGISLQVIDSGEYAIDMCLKLPTIQKYTKKYKELLEGKGYGFPTNQTEALTIKSTFADILSDLDTTMMIVTLPILEPLSPTRLKKLTTIIMSALKASLHVTVVTSLMSVYNQGLTTSKTPTPRDDDLDITAPSVVQKALDIFNSLLHAVDCSARTSGHNVQNLNLNGAWLLLGGLQQIITILSNAAVSCPEKKEDVGRSPSKKDVGVCGRVNLNKVQQGFGGLCVALSVQSISLLNSLMDNAKVEPVLGTVEPARIDPIEPYSAFERIARLFTSIQLNHVLYYIAIVSYRKACSLKKSQRSLQEGDTFSISDSTTFYEDDFSEASIADDDDDSVIIGSWFEEPPQVEVSDRGESSPSNQLINVSPIINKDTLPNATLVPERGDLNGFIDLSATIFKFMNNHFLDSESSYVRQYVRSGFTDIHMTILASLIKDLDKETWKTEYSSSSNSSNQGGSNYRVVSTSLYRYAHNLIASDFLNETLQMSLLTQLGVSPYAVDSDWPLQVFPRTLSVLAQIILLRQKKEKDELKCDTDSACLLIWQKLIATLVKRIRLSSVDNEGDDLNVEHMQLLLFLFQSLQLMQKKSVLINVGCALVSIAPVVKGPMKEMQLLHLSRLLLILDYLIKHLYDAPQYLNEQVQSNLFKPFRETVPNNANNKPYFIMEKLEDNFVKHCSGSKDGQNRPCFYTLTPPQVDMQEAPKLDGLACSFLLATPDSIKYNTLCDTILTFLDIGCQLDKSVRSSSDPQLSCFGLCCLHYAFSLALSTLLTLPPSGSGLEMMLHSEPLFEGPKLLHPIIWGRRSNQKQYLEWIKDGLVRQSVTTQRADVLLKSVANSTCGLMHDIKLVNQVINNFMKKGLGNTTASALTFDQIPTYSELLILDATIVRLHFTLDSLCQKGEIDIRSTGSGDVFQALKITSDQLPISSFVELLKGIHEAIRWTILNDMNTAENDDKINDPLLEAYASILALSGVEAGYFKPCLSKDSLPPMLKSALEFWNLTSLSDFPSVLMSSKSNTAPVEPSSGEGHMMNVINGHISSLSAKPAFSLHTSLKRVSSSLASFVSDIIGLQSDAEKSNSLLVSTLVSLSMDATSDYINTLLSGSMRRIFPPVSEQTNAEIPPVLNEAYYNHVLTNIHKVMVVASKENCFIDENILISCGAFLEKMLDSQSGMTALKTYMVNTNFSDAFFVPFPYLKNEFDKTESLAIPSSVMKFLIKTLQMGEKPPDSCITSICESLPLLHWSKYVVNQDWFIASLLSETDEASDTWMLLKTCASYIATKSQNKVIKEHFFLSTIPMATTFVDKGVDGLNSFCRLLQATYPMLSVVSDEGNVAVFKASVTWIQKVKEMLFGIDKVTGLDDPILKTMAILLPIVTDIIVAIKCQKNSEKWNYNHNIGTTSPPYEPEAAFDNDSDWLEDTSPEDDESAAEDSDEENIGNKLCTFTMTQKEFMNQHWYHCHTCKMVDGVGVCTVCARVCHRGHDITYAKYGSFFCDCGAKEDGSCQALAKRNTGGSTMESVHKRSDSHSYGSLVHRYYKRRTSSHSQNKQTDTAGENLQKRRRHLASTLENVRERIITQVNHYDIQKIILDILTNFMPTIDSLCIQNSSVGSYERSFSALQELHTDSKVITYGGELMTATLGSQEGAFENVRLNYSGEQGQTIRQLISSHMIYRVAMCILTCSGSKRQHLAVSHEKGKLTILQLSSLLKQQDSTKKKLTLTRLSSASLPFTVLSITSNQVNDDYLAVCGVKECQILTINSNGAITDQLALHPNLDAGNYIIRSIWLPGQQTQLAIVTADFVKIYDLNVDVISPQYFFQMPSGKIKDACFVITQNDENHLVLMATSGYIYTQQLCEQSSAKHGPFYVYSVLSVCHPDLKDVNGEVCGGGVSIYYSHTLQLLCFSYAHGKNYLAPLKNISENEQVTTLFSIPLKSANVSSSSNSSLNNNGSSSNRSESSNSSPSKQMQALCQWGEVASHPGLITCVAQNSTFDGNTKGNSPVIIMVKTNSIIVQELKVTPSKSKMADMVALRHSWSSGPDAKTTLIVLCEDGSLRIFNASQVATDFWMSPQMHKDSIMSAFSPSRKRKRPKLSRPSGAVSFPVDFFEHCSVMNDVEFGGNDVLQIYNVSQVKSRLNSQGMYIASTKQGGFQLNATNNDSNMVMVGIRVSVGLLHISKVPSCIEIFCRSIDISASRRRWFDIPFTREESLQCEKNLTITFGQSTDSGGVTIIDSVKVYGKSKEDFGWPEEIDDYAPASSSLNECDSTGAEKSVLPTLTSLDVIVSSSLEILEACAAVESEKNIKWNDIRNLATTFLNMPLPQPVQHHVRSLLATLHLSRNQYHNYKDMAQLKKVVEKINHLTTMPPKQVDCEDFYRLLITARNIAVARPQNLVKYTTSDQESEDGTQEQKVEEKSGQDAESGPTFLENILTIFWSLLKARPKNPILSQVCMPGLTHVEATVQSLIEIINAYASTTPSYIPIAVKIYAEFLLSPELIVSFSAKQALIKVLRPSVRKKKQQSPVQWSTPGDKHNETFDISGSEEGASASLHNPISHTVRSQFEAQINSLQQAGDLLEALRSHGGSGDNSGSLSQSLMGDLLDINTDDDEAMVELAIALSLHEEDTGNEELGQLQEGIENLVGGLQLDGLSGQVLENLLAASNRNNSQPSSNDNQEVENEEAGGGDDTPGQEVEEQLSDTTVSANGSDDDADTPHESNVRATSSNEQVGSAGSDSGASVVDSFGGGENLSTSYPNPGQDLESSDYQLAEQSLTVQTDQLDDDAADTLVVLHSLRLSLLESFLNSIASLKDVGGVRSIPFFQVVMMLSSDLDGQDPKDRACLTNLINILVNQINFKNWEQSSASERTAEKEVQLVILRFLSVMMSKNKSSDSSVIPVVTANILLSSGLLDHCYHLLRCLLEYWKANSKESQSGSVIGGNLLQHKPSSPAPDMSPFFLRQYVKGHANDIFASFQSLLTEMLLRLPYQIKKLCDGYQFEQEWAHMLCEFIMTQQTAVVRRQVRKLLLFICGHKENYRQLRDMHSFDFHFKEIRRLCSEGGYSFSADRNNNISLPYDSLIQLVEHLRACIDIANTRTHNWQSYCLKDESILTFLMEITYLVEDGVAPAVLQLLQAAICFPQKQTSSSSSTSSAATTSKRSSSEESETDKKKQEANIRVLVTQINKYLDKNVLCRFVHTFLLESNSTSVRWQTHSLMVTLHEHSPTKDQEQLLSLFWSLWSYVPSSGRKAAQFVDLLGYFSLKTRNGETKVMEELEKAVHLLKEQSLILTNHPNASIYNSLSSLVEFDGYYLESAPCLVCNNPEVPFSSVKLLSVRVDSRFTTKTQLVKLISSYMISRINLRITDLKRTKMVRTLNIYYNNKTVQAIVELKNKPTMWSKAKKITLSTGQTEIKIEFALPIVACNLMFEYADYYENIQASTETLQCPRCSAAVPASPGVCANCGENVYQCHKCRAINYDEKDPFLCNACGYCKYAKFDYTLNCRPCFAIDPIENENDRIKAVLNIDSLLERADRSYKQLQTYKPTLELYLLLIGEHDLDRGREEGSTGSNQVNKSIHQLAQKYCGDCKSAFDELSKIIQKIQASRRELVKFDRSQKEGAKLFKSSLLSVETSPKTAGKCYGCASSAVEQCITLFRALATNFNIRQGLCKQGLVKNLIEYNLRRGAVQIRVEVRQLLCLLTKDNQDSIEELNALIKERISSAIESQVSSPDLGAAVRYEMSLLATSAKIKDSCWQQRLRCVLQIFTMTLDLMNSPMAVEHITLPCLKILQGAMTVPKSNKTTDAQTQASNDKTKKSKQDPKLETFEAVAGDVKINVDLHKWLSKDLNYSYEAWKARQPKIATNNEEIVKMTKEEIRNRYLMEKYATLWQLKTNKYHKYLKISNETWVKTVLFNSSSRIVRQACVNILESMCSTSFRKKQILDMLTSFLPVIGQYGESASEFVEMYKSMIAECEWKQYVAASGILPVIAELIMTEIEHLTDLEETTLNIDLSQGYALKVLTELLANFMEVGAIKRVFKGRVLATVLTGYLSLRKFIVQRTKLIEDTQNKFLDLLEDMTSGTEKETKEFMTVCINTLNKYPENDLRTPVFIFERLCSIIYPEENDVGEFFMCLEKDPQQEDFLQGRMVGNPYSSQDPSFGPLMRDVKNKICQDCELVALLEDDNGMELLVCNKIISLDLSVKEVYKKIWLTENNDCEAMRIMYRMRGLLGDATEEFVETLDKKKEINVDDEKVYRMASVLSECNGLKAMLDYLERISDLSYAKGLLCVLLKLFQMCVKLKVNREKLCEPNSRAVVVLLHTLKQCLAAELDVVAGPAGGISLTQQVLLILEAILIEAASKEVPELSESCGLEDIHLLLSYVSTSSRTNTPVRERLMRILPFLVFNHKEKMELLIGHFKPALNFDKFDASPTNEDQTKMEAFCVFCSSIEKNQIGQQLQEMIIKVNIVKDALTYIENNIPKTDKFFVGEFYDDSWKEFVAKPSLKYVLRILTGLATKDLRTQQAVSLSCIESIHRLEQISSEEHVGSLAENLLEALKDDPTIVKKVKETRRKTREEKKQLAMKTRKKELERLGLKANEKEQITSGSSLLKDIDQLTEESGLACAICLEGYRCQPSKVLAIYTFSKRCPYEQVENKNCKTLGHSTVSHFNVVHVDCHIAAVRATHPRDEWERAALHNANTKANGLLPLWGPQVPESAFASCLARHNTYLQECTGHRDIGYTSTVHDLKLLLLRFANEKSFSEESGGGGPQSNMNLIPYLLHMALYVMNTTRSGGLEVTKLESYLNHECDTWIDESYDVYGPYYACIMALAVFPPSKWKKRRVSLLKRLLVTSHVRNTSSKAEKKLTDKVVKDWAVYKSATVFWALINFIYSIMFKSVPTDSEWNVALAEYIRNNDQYLIEASGKILQTYQNDVVVSTSLMEVLDVAGLLDEVENPDQFLTDLLESLP